MKALNFKDYLMPTEWDFESEEVREELGSYETWLEESADTTDEALATLERIRKDKPLNRF